MRVRRFGSAVAVTMALAVMACDSPSPSGPEAGASGTQANPGATTTQGQAPAVGIKVDQFGTGYLDIANYHYSGLDAAVAKYIYKAMFGIDDPYFLPVSSQTREQALSSGAVRFFAATYTMNSERAAKFDLAGPYLVTTQGVLVTKNRSDIKSLNDLKGKRVCVNAGKSLSGPIVGKQIPDAIQVPLETYNACLDALRNGNADAFSTDSAILYGYASHQANSDLQVIKGLTVEENIMYGIAFRKSDHDLCLKAKDLIKRMIHDETWDSYFANAIPKYKDDYSNYQTTIRPTESMVETNSCRTPPH